MAAPSHENGPMDRPYTVFDAVSKHDLEGVVEEYIKNARNTIVSYLSMRKRWGRRTELKEEKLDEYLQQLADESTETEGIPSAEKHKVDDAKYKTVLKDISDLFRESQLESASSENSDNMSDDGDRLIGQSAYMLSNSRPPRSFTVRATTGRRTPLGFIEGPPIFDGGVANATPPPLGPPGIRPSGGAGTLLHLACAVDSPFALAVALALGADARSPHTAFRRLMIHEAACGGSINCLRLLLEYGKQCALEVYSSEQLSLTSPPVASKPDSQGTEELPFFPDCMDAKTPSAPSLATPLSTLKPRSNNDDKKKIGVSGKKDWLGILKRFLDFAKQVRLGQLSELDAARNVLEQKTISESMKTIIAQSCSFIVKNCTVAGNPFNSPWYADGHGNTPLHWAAFKNERECVALLLEYHADPNARAHPSGWTALHDAAYSNSSESVELLLDAGAKVDTPANSGATPLCFAAQEDSDAAARVLLARGADMGARCAGAQFRAGTNLPFGPPPPNGRFRGYTPLHYCAHYNAHRAAKVLLLSSAAREAMEIPDLSGCLPIHVAVARGSSDVLRELLHAGARVELPHAPPPSPRRSRRRRRSPSRARSPSRDEARAVEESAPATPPRPAEESDDDESSVTPVSSPLLRSMIPARPVTSSKPWNCLTQRSIDECRLLISQAEQNWAPDRHSLFTPCDRRAVVELLRVGKRLEQSGTGIFIDLWPLVLSFCGRGWFEVRDGDGDGQEEQQEEDCEDLRNNDFITLPSLSLPDDERMAES